jgi:hypothetical protein
MFYNARYYSPYLNRFVSADTFVPEPGKPQALNRYMYTLGNPLKYTDPTGHFSNDEIAGFFGVNSWEEVIKLFESNAFLKGCWGWLELLKDAEAGDYVTFMTDHVSPVKNEFGFTRYAVTLGEEIYSGYLYVNSTNGTLEIGTDGTGELSIWNAAGWGGAYVLREGEWERYGTIYDNDYGLENTYDFNRLDAANIAGDIASIGLSIFSLGWGKQFITANRVATGGGTAIGLAGTTKAKMQGDDFSAGVNFISAIPFTPISLPASVLALAMDLKQGYYYNPNIR